MRRLVYGAEVRALPATMDEAMASRTPTELSFSITEAPRLARSRWIEVGGELENPTPRDVEVIGFPVGDGPFFAEIARPGPVDVWAPDDPARPKELPPPMPPAPPAPVRFVVPAASKLAFSYAIDLIRYQWAGAPVVEIAWSFLFWNEPKPRGLLRFVLPPRP